MKGSEHPQEQPRHEACKQPDQHVACVPTRLVWSDQAGEAGAHRAAFSAAEISLQADGRGGLYDLDLLIGDAAVANPIKWRLGQVTCCNQTACKTRQRGLLGQTLPVPLYNVPLSSKRSRTGAGLTEE